MSYDDIIRSTNYASSQAQAAAEKARQAAMNFPGAETKHKEEISLAIANLAIALRQLTEELRMNNVI